LVLMLNCSFLATDLKFFAELVSVIDVVVIKEFFCSTMFDNELSVSLNWLSKKKRACTIWWDNRPSGIINRIGDKAYLLVSGESSEDLRGALLGMKVELLVIDPGVGYETHLLAISDSVISLVLVDFLYMQN